MNKFICISALFLFSFQSCYDKSPVPIPNTLETALGSRFNNYSYNLNQAWKNDTSAIFYLFKINGIQDAAGYCHAFILLKLLNNMKDSEIMYMLKKMDDSEFTNLRQYIEVGLDQESKVIKKELLKNHPLTFNLLKEKSNMKYLFE